MFFLTESLPTSLNVLKYKNTGLFLPHSTFRTTIIVVVFLHDTVANKEFLKEAACVSAPQLLVSILYSSSSIIYVDLNLITEVVLVTLLAVSFTNVLIITRIINNKTVHMVLSCMEMASI